MLCELAERVARGRALCPAEEGHGGGRPRVQEKTMRLPGRSAQPGRVRKGR